MSEDERLAKNVKYGVDVLNTATKAAVAAGLIVKIEDRCYHTVGERPHQQFSAEVSRPL